MISSTAYISTLRETMTDGDIDELLDRYPCSTARNAIWALESLFS